MEMPVLQTTYKLHTRFIGLSVVYSFISVSLCLSLSLSSLRGHKIQFPHPFGIRISFRPSFFIQVSIWKFHFLAKSFILQLRHSVCRACGLQVRTQPAMQILHRIDDFSDFSFLVLQQGLQPFEFQSCMSAFMQVCALDNTFWPHLFPNCGINTWITSSWCTFSFLPRFSSKWDNK